jgi:hypothetical protein
MIMVVAGIMALVAYVRDREDAGMWPAYVTFAAVVIGIIICVPMLLNTNGMINIGREGKTEQDRILIPAHGALDEAMKTCVHDGQYGGCSAASIARTVAAVNLHIRPQKDCDEPNIVCISENGSGGYLVEYVTVALKSVGSLRIEETRSLQNQILSTTCRPIRPDVDMQQVKAACGATSVVGSPVHSA